MAVEGQFQGLGLPSKYSIVKNCLGLNHIYKSDTLGKQKNATLHRGVIDIEELFFQIRRVVGSNNVWQIINKSQFSCPGQMLSSSNKRLVSAIRPNVRVSFVWVQTGSVPL